MDFWLVMGCVTPWFLSEKGGLHLFFKNLYHMGNVDVAINCLPSQWPFYQKLSLASWTQARKVRPRKWRSRIFSSIRTFAKAAIPFCRDWWYVYICIFFLNSHRPIFLVWECPFYPFLRLGCTDVSVSALVWRQWKYCAQKTRSLSPNPFFGLAVVLVATCYWICIHVLGVKFNHSVYVSADHGGSWFPKMWLIWMMISFPNGWVPFLWVSWLPGRVNRYPEVRLETSSSLGFVKCIPTKFK